MNIEKVFDFVKKIYEKNKDDRRILKKSTVLMVLYLRILFGLVLLYKYFQIMGGNYSSFWVNFLAVYLIPYIAGLLYFHLNPVGGLATIQKISGLQVLGGLFSAFSAGIMIGFFWFITLLPLDIYLYFKSSSLYERFRKREADHYWSAFICIAVLSASILYAGPYLALRVHYLDVDYIDVKGEVVGISGLISPDGKYAVRKDTLYDFIKLQKGKREGHYVGLYLGNLSPAFSSDSKYIALGGVPKENKELLGITIVEIEKAMMNEKTITKFGEAPEELKLTFSRELLGDNAVLGMAFSPDGRYFACETEKAVVLWELGTGNVFKLLSRDFLHEDSKYYQKAKTALRFSADSKKLLTSASESGEYTMGKVYIWDVDSKKLFKSIDIGKGNIKQIKFSPDGNKLVYLFNGYPYNKMAQYAEVPEEAHRIVAIWNIEAEKMERFIYDKDGGHGYIELMDYSSDGKYIATVVGGQDMVSIWDAATGKKIKVLKPHINNAVPEELTYSLDGEYLEVDSGQIIKERWQRGKFGI